MREKRWAISIPMDGFSLAEHAELCREAEGWGYTDAWSFEADGLDAFSPLAVAGLATRMRLGTAIVNVYTRGPATLASCAAGIAEIAPGRFCLGLGAGSQPIVESWNGLPFGRPAARVREMVGFLRRALTGERVVWKGQTFSVDGFRLIRPPTEPVPIHVAALRAGMLRVAGEVADGAIINWLSVEDVPRSVKVVRDAATAAGRDPESVEITARLLVSIDPPGPEADLALKRQITGYLNVPVYRAFHEWLGRTGQLSPMWDAWARGDRRGAVAAVPDRLVGDLFLRGSVEDIRAHVHRYLDAGVDTAFLQLITFDPEAPRRRERQREVLRALAPPRR